jgi:hypothetical protein
VHTRRREEHEQQNQNEDAQENKSSVGGGKNSASRKQREKDWNFCDEERSQFPDDNSARLRPRKSKREILRENPIAAGDHGSDREIEIEIEEHNTRIKTQILNP